MTRPSHILDLYRASELLQRSCQAFELAGNADGARYCRDAACSVLQAVSAAVKERAETTDASEITS